MTGAGRCVGRLFAGLAGCTGWRRWASSFALGALAAAAQPPVHLIPVLIVSFAGLVRLLDGAPRGRVAFAVGWWFGAGYFAAGLYWVSYALLVDAARFAWLIPPALLALSFGLGLFVGAAAWLARRIAAEGIWRVAARAGSWVLLEWARGVVLTGFPWNPVGNVWVAALPVLQAASWIGVYGLSLLTVFAAAAPAVLAGPAPARTRWAGALPGLALLAGPAAAGTARLSGDAGKTVPGVTLRIVQPDIAQQDKWRPDVRAANFALHLRLSGPRGGGTATHVVWPETAAPFSVATDLRGRDLLRAAVPPGGLLLTGAPRFRAENGRVVQIWNGLAAVDDRGETVALYDKHHLVPFGEYTPFRDILPLEKITVGSLDFSAGPGPATLRLPGLPPVSPLICYEAIFPGAVTVPGDRAAWLLNITNDAWFGISAGPHQHLASARLRAVEEGLPLVRAANTGISAVVDPYGRDVARLALGVRGVIDSALPLALPPTPFSRYGNAVPLALALLFLGVSALFARKRRAPNI